MLKQIRDPLDVWPRRCVTYQSVFYKNIVIYNASSDKFFSRLDVSFEICLMYFRNFINVCNDSNDELT